MSFQLVDILRWFRPFRRLERENARLRAELESERTRLGAELEQERRNTRDWRRFHPPGHFYSPLPSPEEIADAFARGASGPPFADIDLNEAGQVRLMQELARHYASHPYSEHPTPGHRYYLANASYEWFDAIILHCMLCHARPQRVIEVGSGFSSAAMLDTNDAVLGRSVRFTFIDPDMSRLRPLLRPGDASAVTLLEQRVQDVPLDVFRTLSANDILFIDSSHVSKVGSDVNRLFFEVLPVLPPGVIIHIHDIAADLEYPRPWLESGRAWNEQYLLRAFLMNNHAYRVELLTAWFFNTHYAWLQEHLPLCAARGGGQMWLRKLG